MIQIRNESGIVTKILTENRLHWPEDDLLRFVWKLMIKYKKLYPCGSRSVIVARNWVAPARPGGTACPLQLPLKKYHVTHAPPGKLGKTPIGYGPLAFSFPMVETLSRRNLSNLQKSHTIFIFKKSDIFLFQKVCCFLGQMCVRSLGFHSIQISGQHVTRDVAPVLGKEKRNLIFIKGKSNKILRLT
jgi:hypothetical protein